MGKSCCKCHEVGMCANQTKPYTPWFNAAEGTIWELKHRAGGKMAKLSSPAKLWDHCLELEAYIRSHTALDKYKLQGQVPQTIVLGQTMDISPFIEHPFYAWVKFWDNLAKYPEPKEQLGRWLGPAIDIGPAMTAKILKSSRQVPYMSMYRAKTWTLILQTHIMSFMRMILKLTNMFLTLMMMSIQKQETCMLGLKFHYHTGLLNRLAKLFTRPGIRTVN